MSNTRKHQAGSGKRGARGERTVKDLFAELSVSDESPVASSLPLTTHVDGARRSPPPASRQSSATSFVAPSAVAGGTSPLPATASGMLRGTSPQLHPLRQAREQQPFAHASSTAALATRTAWTVAAVLTSTLTLLAAIFQMYDPAFPLLPVLLCASVFHVLVPVGVALSGLLELGTSRGFELFQPLQGGPRFIALQVSGYVSWASGLVCIIVFAVKDFQHLPVPLRRAALLYLACAFAVVSTVLLSQSLRHFEALEGYQAPDVPASPTGNNSQRITAKNQRLRTQQRRLGARFLAIVVALVVLAFAIAAEADPALRRACYVAELLLHVFSAAVSHFIVGWIHTPGYHLFMPFSHASTWRNAIQGMVWAAYSAVLALLGVSVWVGTADPISTTGDAGPAACAASVTRGWDLCLGLLSTLTCITVQIEVAASVLPVAAATIPPAERRDSRSSSRRYLPAVLTLIGVSASLASLLLPTVLDAVAEGVLKWQLPRGGSAAGSNFETTLRALFTTIALAAPVVTLLHQHRVTAGRFWRGMRRSSEVAMLSTLAWTTWILGFVAMATLPESASLGWGSALSGFSQLCLLQAISTWKAATPRLESGSPTTSLKPTVDGAAGQGLQCHGGRRDATLPPRSTDDNDDPYHDDTPLSSASASATNSPQKFERALHSARFDPLHDSGSSSSSPASAFLLVTLFNVEFFFACSMLAMSFLLRLLCDYLKAASSAPTLVGESAATPISPETLLLASGLFWTVAVPAVHMSGRSADDSQDEPWFQPFKGSAEYVAMQAVGWTFYALGLMLLLTTPVESCFTLAYPLACTAQATVSTVPFVALALSNYFRYFDNARIRNGGTSLGGTRDRRELSSMSLHVRGISYDASPYDLRDLIHDVAVHADSLADLRQLALAVDRDGGRGPADHGSGHSSSSPLKHLLHVLLAAADEEADNDAQRRATVDEGAAGMDAPPESIPVDPRPRIGTSVVLSSAVAAASGVLCVLADYRQFESLVAAASGSLSAVPGGDASSSVSGRLSQFVPILAVLSLVSSIVDTSGIHLVYGRYCHGRFGYEAIMPLRGGAAFVVWQVSSLVFLGAAITAFIVNVLQVQEWRAWLAYQPAPTAGAATPAATVVLARVASLRGISSLPLLLCGAFSLASPLCMLVSVFKFDRESASPKAVRASSAINLAEPEADGGTMPLGDGAAALPTFLDRNREVMLAIMLFTASWAGSAFLGVYESLGGFLRPRVSSNATTPAAGGGEFVSSSSSFAITVPLLTVSVLASVIAVPLATIGLARAFWQHQPPSLDKGATDGPGATDGDAEESLDDDDDDARRSKLAAAARHRRRSPAPSALAASPMPGLSPETRTGSVVTLLLVLCAFIGPLIAVFALHYLFVAQGEYMAAALAAMFRVVSGLVPVLLLAALLSLTSLRDWPSVFHDVGASIFAISLYAMPAIIPIILGLPAARLTVSGIAFALFFFTPGLFPTSIVARQFFRWCCALLLGYDCYQGIALSFSALMTHLRPFAQLPTGAGREAAAAAANAVWFAIVDVAAAWIDPLLTAVALAYLLSVRTGGGRKADGSPRLGPERDGTSYSPAVVGLFTRFVIPLMARYFSFAALPTPPMTAVDGGAKPTPLADTQIHLGLDQVVFGFHPHGIFPGTVLWCTKTKAWRDAVDRSASWRAPEDTPRRRVTVHAATVVFRLPLIRELVMAIGGMDVCRGSIEEAVKLGYSPWIVPGGQAELVESLASPRGDLRIVTRHIGFIRLAMQHQLPVVPVVCHGEDRIFSNLGPRSWQRRLLPLLGIPFPFLPLGRWLLPIPRTSRLTLVPGRPILTKGVEELDIVATAYFDELRRIFDATKKAAGYPDAKLTFVDRWKSGDHSQTRKSH